VELFLCSTYALPSPETHKYLPIATALLSEDSAKECQFGIDSALLLFLYLYSVQCKETLLLCLNKHLYIQMCGERGGAAPRIIDFDLDKGK
jgi:hypothetical protein